MKYLLLQELNLIRVFPGFDLSWTWGALPIILDDHLDSAHLIKMAADEGVEMRVWWGFGLHTHTKFQKNVASKFMNTEKATSQIVNIPFFPTLTITEVTTVLNILHKFEKHYK